MAKKLIVEVTGVYATYSKGKVELFATGLTSTPGWTNPELRVVPNITPPIIEFVAEPPSKPPGGGVIIDVTEGIAASLSLDVQPKPTDEKIFR